jgi:hypothetical protein
MSKKMDNIFTPEAAERWNQMAPSIRKVLLGNVFCGTCGGSVEAEIESGEMRGRDLVLYGRCKRCGGRVGRVIEPEDEWD